MTTSLDPADGSLRTIDGRDVLTYERRLEHSVERVWRAITQPEEIVRWLAEAELEPAAGGTVFLRWLNTPEQTVARGTVTVFEPPRVLELDTDVHGILRWELEEDGDGCRLVFTAALPVEAEPNLKLLAGWHIHLDHLAEALEGRPQDWSRWMEDQLPQWRVYHDRYAARFSVQPLRDG
jgi:uncharacterized protein YndB with AHSA1/START domain